MDDEQLIHRCQQGDRMAFDTLLQTHYDIIYRIAYKWCNDTHNAQDIAQQACIKLANNIRQFKFDCKFSSWLYRLVINCAKDFYKSPNQVTPLRAQAQLDHDSCVSNNDTSNHRPDNMRYTQEILEHINQLPTDLRDTLVLVFGTGLNHRQAAVELDVKESTISWRIHEARKILKQTFESPSLSTSSADSTGGAA